jgi:uncharacterized protein YjbI with pentapeptide repeats
MSDPQHMSILNQGVEAWNEWRDQNPSVIPNLKRANLRGYVLDGVNFRGVNLRWTILHKASLRNADLGGTILANADLREVDLTGANLDSADMYNVDLRNAILVGSSLDKSVLDRTTALPDRMPKKE